MLDHCQTGNPPAQVLAMAFDMQSRRWPQEPSEIALSKDGRVIAGADLLAALIEAKVTLPFLVTIRE